MNPNGLNNNKASCGSQFPQLPLCPQKVPRIQLVARRRRGGVTEWRQGRVGIESSRMNGGSPIITVIVHRAADRSSSMAILLLVAKDDDDG